MQNNIYIRILFLFLVCCVPVSTGMAGELMVKHLGVEDGLSHGTVSSFLQDDEGYIWIGTRSGLNRYDGYEFHHFDHIPGDSLHLADSTIRDITHDGGSSLWIATENGLSHFNKRTRTWRSYYNDPDDPGSLSNSYITAVLYDHEGTLWVGTGWGLNRFDAETGTFEHFTPGRPGLFDADRNRIWALAEDENGGLWVGTDEGVRLLDRESGKFDERYPPIKGEHVVEICDGGDGILWVGTRDGLVRIDDNTGNHTIYTTDNVLSNNRVMGLAMDGQGRLWIGSSDGLTIFDPGDGSFLHEYHEQDNPASLSGNEISEVYSDRNGFMWIGTLHYGVNIYNPEQENVIIHHKHNGVKNADDNNIMALHEDPAGRVWVGSDDGLDLFDPGNQEFSKVPGSVEIIETMEKGVVRDICDGADGTIWIAAHYNDDGVLSNYDPETHIHTLYRHNPADSLSLSTNQVNSVLMDDIGRLWVGTSGQGLNVMHGDGVFRHIKLNGPEHLMNNWITDIFQDSDGNIWVGTTIGLARWIEDRQEFETYVPELGNSRSISNNRIRAIYEDSVGHLWVGTENGLNRYDRETDTWTIYDQFDGLPNTMISSIIEDEFGDIWLSTARGIWRFDPVGERFRGFMGQSVLQNIIGNVGASLRLSTGNIFFGTRDGIVMLDPKHMVQSDEPPPVVITGVSLFDRTDRRTVSPYETNAIVLDNDENYLWFDFAVLDYVEPRSNRFFYRLENFDRGWINAGVRHTASYPDLPPGQYVFRVKGVGHSGVWNEEGAMIRIIIKPTLWNTGWFRYLLVVMALSLLYSGHALIVRRMEMNREHLENLVAERTELIERKSEEVRRNEKLYRTLVETSPDAILAVDSDGVITMANHKTAEMLGVPLPHKLVGKRATDFVFPDDARYINNDVALINTNGTVRNIELRIMNTAGDIVPVEIDASVMTFTYDSPRQIIAVVRDISDRKRLQEQIHMRQKMDSIGTLVGGIAHDFNNLLAVIMGNIELLRLDNGQLTPDQNDFIETSYQSCLRAASLIQELQMLANSEHADRCVVDLYVILEEVFGALDRTGGETIAKEIGFRAGEYLLNASADQLHHVLYNLGTNSIEAIRENIGKTGAAISVSAEGYTVAEHDRTGLEPGEYVHIVFSDNGVGMTEDVRRRAFDPLFSTHHRTTRKGQGLGLAMVYNIVTGHHGGFVEIMSAPGEGTRVHMYLPAAESGSFVVQENIRRISSGTRTILVIDDEEQVRRMVVSALEHYGYSVITAADGEEGLAVFEERQDEVDLVLLDLLMPNISGEQLAEIIRGRRPDIPIVMASGYCEDTVSHSKAPNAYLKKPFHLDELVAVVGRFFDA